jgi:hypothetical protein
MNRELALKIALAVVGLLFIALAYPMVIFIRQAPALSMQFSLYVTLGVFLLLAVRNPSANRSVIAFTAWSSFAHAALMGTQACRNMVARGELIGGGCSCAHRRRVDRTGAIEAGSGVSVTP